ncbi:SapC family protein [Actibacterium sp. 188UL27-1]|uniref:SapC family protein n=1 Tax=Actibacterium sp. 188UL27-1 TaxID=2786961 RepID=UPI00195BDA7C|nr:SapC family protein [Actibacterium sp. 188UL27-1]MBM7070299.1 SapC family protein [Actibacterium sp. 188UL27-1]
MVKRRAVSRHDKQLQPETLPLLYQTLVPLSPEGQGSLGFQADRDFSFAARANAIPLTADEFPMALKDYPIVFSAGAKSTPLALVGMQQGRNDHVTADGSWRTGTYIPAYLRRYPFALVRESDTAERNILCADLSSTLFSTTAAPDRMMFEDGKSSKLLTGILEFCNRYEVALHRTRLMVEDAQKHDLIGPSTVSISRGGKTLRVEGFCVVSEERLRDLPDDVLASFARRGVLNIFAAHQMSLSNFSTFGEVLA